MKTIFSLTALSGITLANVTQMKSDIEKLNVNGDSLMRGLVQADMGMLNQYGCWCYFEDDHGSGRGQPVDEVDKFCKTLHDGYSCILMDTEAWEDECIPWETDYESAMGMGGLNGMTMSELQNECEVKNGEGTCASLTCAVEGWFVQSFFLYSVNGGTLNQEMMHSNGFDVNDSCPIKQGEFSEKECCGQYPERFPFKTSNGVRGCCGQRTYDSQMYKCCEVDGGYRVKMVCPGQ